MAPAGSERCYSAGESPVESRARTPARSRPDGCVSRSGRTWKSDSVRRRWSSGTSHGTGARHALPAVQVRRHHVGDARSHEHCVSTDSAQDARHRASLPSVGAGRSRSFCARGNAMGIDPAWPMDCFGSARASTRAVVYEMRASRERARIEPKTPGDVTPE